MQRKQMKTENTWSFCTSSFLIWKLLYQYVYGAFINLSLKFLMYLVRQAQKLMNKRREKIYKMCQKAKLNVPDLRGHLHL